MAITQLPFMSVVLPYYQAWASPVLPANIQAQLLSFTLEPAEIQEGPMVFERFGTCVNPYYAHLTRVRKIVQQDHSWLQSLQEPQLQWWHRANDHITDLSLQVMSMEECVSKKHEPHRLDAYQESARHFIQSFSSQITFAAQAVEPIEQALARAEILLLAGS